jgi:sterol desaturase/sphingolipid hydroxylase (fatty acid hydroxylase superfamily)
MDFVELLFLIAFEAIVGAPAVLLVLTYVSFRRMERNVRRARMFIMADRIQRFLGAFTLGFVVLAGVFVSSFLGNILPPAVFIGAFFFFLAMIAYGVVELFFIVRPKRTPGARSFLRRPAGTATADQGNPRTERAEDDLDASR